MVCRKWQPIKEVNPMEAYDKEYLTLPDTSKHGAYSKLRSKYEAPKEKRFKLFWGKRNFNDSGQQSKAREQLMLLR